MNHKSDVVLLCNPLAGGRWNALADVLDSEEAKHARRIVTDDIDDVGATIADLGTRVKLLCIYGGDGTVYRVIQELMRRPHVEPPRLAILGGGTMNVTARWCGMSSSPGENFRAVMRAYLSDRLVWREVPLLSVQDATATRFGFSFLVGPLVRILDHFERGRKHPAMALAVAGEAIASAVSGYPKKFQPIVKEMEGSVTVDGVELPHKRFAAVVANTTGIINPFVEPFVTPRTRDTFHFLAYGVSSREFAVMAPLLTRAMVPMDPKSVLRPLSVWRQALLTLAGKGLLPLDPRYVNRPAHKIRIETSDEKYTIDGELFPVDGAPIDVHLGPSLSLAVLKAKRPPRRMRKPRKPAKT